MTAKHRKGKGNNKHEDNFFKNDLPESEARVGGNQYMLPLVFLVIVVIGGAFGAWFCFQQNQTVTYLSDSLMGLQMKMVKLQSSHEDLRQSSGKQHVSESLENRLNALEESYALAQKQMGMALSSAEQLKTSDLPAQVLSLHTEMKARLTEMQQSTASLEQLNHLHTTLDGKSQEFQGIRNQVDGLVTLSAELSQKVELLTGRLGEAESKLNGQVASLSTTLDAQAAEVLRLKKQLNVYQAQVEASTQDVATVRDLLEGETSPLLHISVDEQLNTLRQSLQDQSSAALELKTQLENVQKQVTQLMGGHPTEPTDQTDEETASSAREAAPAVTEEEPLAAVVENEALGPEEEAEASDHGEAPVQEEASIEQQDAVTEMLTSAEQVEVVKEDQPEQDETDDSSENTEVETTQTDEKIPEEENQEADEEEEEEESEGKEAAKESQLEEDSQKTEEDEDEDEDEEEDEQEEEVETEEADTNNQPEEEAAAASEEEREQEDALLEDEELDLDKEVTEEQQDVAAEGEEPSENDSLAEDECK